MEVRSDEGKGTAFTVTLPLRKANDANSSELLPVIAIDEPISLIPNLPSLSDSSPLVLVVEDHEDLRNFIASGLSQKYRVLTAQNGKEGWQLALQELPDLVIADVAMPEMDGITLTQIIKNTP
ncbi:MAG: response regulator [Segetibacter sp.]